MIDNPGGVQKVILTTRQNAPANVNTAQNTPTSPQYQPPPDETRDEEMTGPDAEAENPVWSKISNALKRLGFRFHNFLAQLLSETSRACTIRVQRSSFREALE